MAFSRILGTNGRFEIGLYFFMRFLYRERFFRSGLTTAVFSESGTEPEDSDVLMMCVTVGRRTSMSSKSSLVGMGSSSHDLGGVFLGISKAD